MTPITIVTIVVVALLTIVIFGLAWLGYSSCIRAYGMEVKAGKHDDTIVEEHLADRKPGLVGIVTSYLALFLFATLLVGGIIYKVRGENFSFNNETVLVVKSGSMSKFFDEQTAAEYDNDDSLHFDVGDICIFSNTVELVEGQVYAYSSNGNLIIHRLIERQADGLCRFRGDANPIADVGLVAPERIVLQYTGRRIPGLGTFILYAQSPFGIWSLCGMTGVVISSEIVVYKIKVINMERLKKLGGRKK